MCLNNIQKINKLVLKDHNNIDNNNINFYKQLKILRK